MYVLNNGHYEVTTCGTVRVEYMDSCYYNKIVEYTSYDSIVVEIEGFETMETASKVQSATPSSMENILKPTRIYTEDELRVLNQD